MKFALLISATAAIKIQSEAGPSCGQIADHIYDQCDGNGDHGISWGEARKCGAPKAWKSEFLRVAGEDGIVDRAEFVGECRKHMGNAQTTATGGPTCGQIADHIYDQCDSNGDHGVSWGEARKCGAPKAWKGDFLRVAGEDGIVDRAEFIGECRKHMGNAQTEQGPPTCGQIADHIYDQCDSNGDHGVSWSEARKCGAPKAWKGDFLRVAGEDGIVDRAEFVGECRKHMGNAQTKQGPPCPAIADQLWKMCDGNGDGNINWTEAKKCGAGKEDKPIFDEIAGDDGKATKTEFIDACEAHFDQ
jgi:hypothetical protein